MSGSGVILGQDRPLTEDDRAAVRGYLVTWARGTPCAKCGWPFPNAPYHLCVEPPDALALQTELTPPVPKP